jgi:hypothetical protein
MVVDGKKSYTGLIISNYDSEDINPLLPLLSEEFPDWSIDKIKGYIGLVIKNKKDVAGILVAKNEAYYNVGLLIYTIQQVQTKTKEIENKGLENCVVIENLVASSPILQKQVFLLMVEEVFKIAKNTSCKFIELPRLDSGYMLVKDKYKTKIQNVNGFRTFLKVSDVLSA